ncbi:GNAT family N-acetyltransferase [Liquorilactobacillus oeni]|uniref:N-acetyltransferase domain-containing protein n=1 Tax=Liquorilactobacillus oeni DSM 19972 TaxID=1423777 RepID=A0A0R1MIB7_9LACO|nr:GNAT family N-acetyltransferase [Liquorilactobacillus oeni]KRL04890.1 hypothetical protein FD46_GL002028 [Liquorilactobacillus oeni DSM 19972]
MLAVWNGNAFDYYRSQTDKTPVAHIGFKLINDNQTYVVEHTWVSEKERGKGLAGKITKEFLQRVTEQKKKVLPLCPYTQSFFQRNSEYRYLLADKS